MKETVVELVLSVETVVGLVLSVRKDFIGYSLNYFISEVYITW